MSTSAKPKPKVAATKRKSVPLAKNKLISKTDPTEESLRLSIPVVAVGASAGGLFAFQELLGALSTSTGMAYVIISHLDPTKESSLVEILSKATTMPLMNAENKITIQANHVYILSPGKDITIKNNVLLLSTRSLHRSRPVVIDQFMRSLALDKGSRAIGIMLSGTGTDGSLGIRDIKENGGITMAQDASAEFTDMPNAAIEMGCVDKILPPAGIAEELERISKEAYITSSELPIDAKADENRDALVKILALVSASKGVNFAHYKSPTILRRIARRMALLKTPHLVAYLAYVEQTPDEIDNLYHDILIKVTSFFRDPEMFDALKKEVFPHLATRATDAPIRVWVPACSTGEEAYSIAMALLEYLGESGASLQIQIFATDINERALDIARAGLYVENISLDVTPERLNRFFTRVKNSYQISKTLRQIVVFAKQDVVNDPPFSRMDMVTFRNSLIYMDTNYQSQALQAIYYGLNPSGFFITGASESIGTHDNLFACIDTKNKIYTKKITRAKLRFNFPGREHAFDPTHLGGGRSKKPTQVDFSWPSSQPFLKEADRILLTEFAPAAVVINSEMDVLQFRGQTSVFLDMPTGRASFNLLRMVRGYLAMELQKLIDESKKKKHRTRKEGVVFKHGSEIRIVNLEVVPFDAQFGEQFFLVLFEETKKDSGKVHDGASLKGLLKESEGDETFNRLSDELVSTKAYLQSIIADREISNEMLQTANEEVLSSNEELQSINEELETAKEELQSTNEELTTVNEEMHIRNTELNAINNDLTNFLASSKIPIIMLGSDFRIRRFTSSAERIFNLIPADIGRPLTDINSSVRIPDLAGTIRQVMNEGRTVEQEVQNKEGRWYALRVQPIITAGHEESGVVLSLEDIDTLKRASDRATELSERYKLLFEETFKNASDGIIIKDPATGLIADVNPFLIKLLGYSKEELVGKQFTEIEAVTAHPETLKVLEDALMREDAYLSLDDLRLRTKDGRELTVGLIRNIFLIGDVKIVQTIIQDATIRADMNRKKDEFIGMASHELKTPLTTIQAFTQILIKRMERENSTENLSYLKKMQLQIDRLSNLIKDLLDVSKVEAGQLKLVTEEVDLESLIRETVSDAQSVNARIKIEIAQSTRLRVWADKERISQVLENFISNAVKYAPNTEKIIIALRESDGQAVVSVQDFGIGVPSEQKEKIFERYFRATGQQYDTFSGLGIGLYICAQIIERHHGRIWVDSRAGEGTTFFFSLPLKKK